MTRRTRLILAGILAPLIGIAALAVLLTALLSRTRSGAGLVRATFDGGFYLLFFGAPVAYVVELAVGLPTYLYLRARGRLTVLRITGAATLIGAELFLVASGAVASTAPRDWLVAACLGALAGAMAGLAFWGVGLFPAASRPAA